VTAFKSSGLGWTDKIPAHWNVAKVCLVARLESGHTPSRLHPEYWVAEECSIPWFSLGDVWQLREGIREYLAETKEKISPRGMANSAARLLPAGTVVLSRTASVGFTGIMPESMATTQDFANWICGPRLLPEFLLYAFRGMADEFERMMMGSTHQTIYMPDIRRLSIPVPPREEQSRIVHLLRQRLPKLDSLIAKKERLIELLQEKRQALITQAVTKGLDPNVPMKESGFPWIGDVPRHWQVVAIKRTAKPGRATFTDGDWIETPFITDGGVRLLQTGNVGIGRYKEQGFRYVSAQTFYELRCTEVSPGDVLICRLDGPVGRACIAPALGVRMITSVDNAILKPRSDCDSRFLVYVLSSPKYLDWVQVLCRVGGGFRFRVSRSMLGDIAIPVPPGDEQRRISDLLGEQTARLVEIEAKLEVNCERLREYRQALITAAVTGKIDVSKEAA
jgi:type I restriction enzyme S subunit